MTAHLFFSAVWPVLSPYFSPALMVGLFEILPARSGTLEGACVFHFAFHQLSPLCKTRPLQGGANRLRTLLERPNTGRIKKDAKDG